MIRSHSLPLPVSHPFTRDYGLSILVAGLMTAASAAGLLLQSRIYPTEALHRSFVSNDVVNLSIGLPLLLASLALARRGRLMGLLFWPGALFYITYNYLAYAVAMPFGWLTLLYLALVALSVYGIIRLVTGIDGAAVQQRLAGKVPERFAGGVLVGLGALFFLRAVGQIASALSGGQPLSGPELGVLVADLLTTPVWVVGGVQLWRRRALGYVSGAGLLFQASMLFVGLLVFFILQPFLTAAPFPMEDFVVIFGMGLVCFIPFGLFVRGAALR